MWLQCSCQGGVYLQTNCLCRGWTEAKPLGYMRSFHSYFSLDNEEKLSCESKGCCTSCPSSQGYYLLFSISALPLHGFGFNALCRSVSTETADLFYKLCRIYRTQTHSRRALTAQAHSPKLEMQILHGEPAQNTEITPNQPGQGSVQLLRAAGVCYV